MTSRTCLLFLITFQPVSNLRKLGCHHLMMWVSCLFLFLDTIIFNILLSLVTTCTYASPGIVDDGNNNIYEEWSGFLHNSRYRKDISLVIVIETAIQTKVMLEYFYYSIDGLHDDKSFIHNIKNILKFWWLHLELWMMETQSMKNEAASYITLDITRKYLWWL